jgi:hypothetical protein
MTRVSSLRRALFRWIDQLSEEFQEGLVLQDTEKSPSQVVNHFETSGEFLGKNWLVLVAWHTKGLIEKKQF